MDNEKRGPVEKGQKGWPINPIGVAAILVFALITIFLIVKPLISQKSQTINQQSNTQGGRIISPANGDIVKSNNLKLEMSVDEPQKAQKVQFWAKTYADNKWEMIGEVSSSPYTLDWQIPDNFKNKAIAITSHIIQSGGTEIKDPGGWREGIIILSN